MDGFTIERGLGCRMVGFTIESGLGNRIVGFTRSGGSASLFSSVHDFNAKTCDSKPRF